MGKALGNIDFPPIIYYLPRAIPMRSADFYLVKFKIYFQLVERFEKKIHLVIDNLNENQR